LVAENLFLRKQLAFYGEPRKVPEGPERAAMPPKTGHGDSSLTAGEWVYGLRQRGKGKVQCRKFRLKIFVDDREEASQEVAIRHFSSPDDVTFGERFTRKIDEVRISVE
jgi:hypothetical protein